jgi:hypothetical protein
MCGAANGTKPHGQAHRAGDLRGPFEVPFVGPEQEHLESILPPLDCSLGVVARFQGFEVFVAPESQGVRSVAVQAVGLRRIAAALFLRATGQQTCSFYAFPSGHGVVKVGCYRYVTMRRNRAFQMRKPVTPLPSR